MANIKIVSLDLPERVLEKLHSVSIYTAKDLLCKTPFELVNILNMSYSRINSILDNVYKNLSIFRPINAFQLYNKEEQEQKTLDLVNESIDYYDKFVNDNGILNRGMICEIVGPPGCGKTQFSFQLSIQAYLLSNFCKNNKQQGSILYIDTENTFSAERLMQIAKHRFAQKCKDECELINMLKFIYVYKISSCDSLIKALDEIEYEIIQKNSQLLIIDSIASIVRRDFCGAQATSRNRNMFLANVSSRLKEIAYILDIPILITNQITSVYASKDIVNKHSNNIDYIETSEQDESTFAAVNNYNNNNTNNDEGSTIAALGSSWSHYVNIRLIVQYANDHQRELLIAKSPISPFRKYYYKIAKNGLEFSGFDQIYEGNDINMQKIKTKPYNNNLVVFQK